MRPTDALPHPSDWSVVTVRQAVEIRRGVSWSKEQEYPEPKAGAVAVLRISNVQDRLDLSDILYLTGIPEKAKAQKKAGNQWTILVGSNGNRNRIGNAVHIEKDTDFLFASFLIGAKPYAESGVQPDFFFRWLSTHEVQHRLSASSEGSTGLSNLSHDFFRAMEIAFPDREEQKAIVRILDAVDAAIERTRTAIEKAQRLRRGLLQQLLTQGVHQRPLKATPVGRIPVTWDCAHLENFIAEGPTNGLYRPESDYGPDGTPIVRIDSFDDGTIHGLSSLRRVRLAEVEVARYSLTENDLLINRVNALSHVGKAAIVPRLSEPTVFESNMMRVRLDSGLLPQFLILVLGSDIARAQWLASAKPAVNQASINQRDVRRFWAPTPDPTEQQKIVDLIAGVDAERSELHRLIGLYERLKRGLMQDLLTGRVRVGHAADSSPARQLPLFDMES